MELSIMEPTYTDRCHYFILEFREGSSSQLESFVGSFNEGSLEDQKNCNTEIQLIGNEAKVTLDYIGGFAVPNEESRKEYREKSRFLKKISYAFYFTFLIFVISALLSFILVLTPLSFLVFYLGIIFMSSFFLFLVVGIIIIIVFSKFDKAASKFNYDLMKNTLELLVESISDLYPNLNIRRFAIKTETGMRWIGRELPEDFLEKFKHLGYDQLEIRFWDV